MLSLSNILKLNAISSGAAGILLLLFPAQAANIFTVQVTAPFVEVGIFLIAFSLFVFIVGTGNPIKSKLVRIVVALDALWVIASAVAVLFLYSSISTWGIIVIVGIALWVALMAYLQHAAWKASFTVS